MSLPPTTTIGSAAATPPRHTFTDLPCEVRKKIYNKVFADDTENNPSGIPIPHTSALICTNRQIRSEGYGRFLVLTGMRRLRARFAMFQAQHRAANPSGSPPYVPSVEQQRDLLRELEG